MSCFNSPLLCPSSVVGCTTGEGSQARPSLTHGRQYPVNCCVQKKYSMEAGVLTSPLGQWHVGLTTRKTGHFRRHCLVLILGMSLAFRGSTSWVIPVRQALARWFPFIFIFTRRLDGFHRERWYRCLVGSKHEPSCSVLRQRYSRSGSVRVPHLRRVGVPRTSCRAVSAVLKIQK